MAQYEYAQDFFKGKGNLKIAYQSWIVPRTKGVVVIVHGLGEHSGRYTNIIERMKGKGISFYALDLRGHGRSEGKRGHVKSFLDYVHDLKLFVNKVKKKNEDVPLFLLGHSMGASIAIRFVLTFQNEIAGLILSAPSLVPVMEIPGWRITFASILSAFMPSCNLASVVNVPDLSHDEEVVQSYLSDELVHNRNSARLLAEFIKNNQSCLERADELRLPLLVLHGEEDRISSSKGAVYMVDRAQSKDKTLEIFPGLFHEIMNEEKLAREKVLQVISKWILAQMSQSKQAVPKTTAEKSKKTLTSSSTEKKSKRSKTAAKKTGKKKASAKKVTSKKSSKKTTKTKKKK
jgi:acylglycerol lipase